MKNEIEQGLADFIAAAIRVSKELAVDADIPGLQVLSATAGQTIEPREIQIVTLCERTELIAGNLYYAHVVIAIGTEKARGSHASHKEYQRLLRRIFPAAEPPALSVNAAHLSEYLETASGGDLSGRGFVLEDTDSDHGGDRFIDSFRQKHLIAIDCASPLVSEGAITVA